VAAKKRKKNASPQKSKLEKYGYGKADLTVGELRRALKKGQEHAELAEWEKALPYLLKAWDAMPDDLSLLTLLSHALAQLGVRDKAVLVLERTLSIHGATPEILGVMLSLSLELGMHEVAVKLCLTLIEMEPANPNHYVNLATGYTGVGKLDESIEMLQGVLPLFPEDSNLWNVLATQVRSRHGVEASIVFFEEALRLAPNDFKILSNYGQSLLMKGDFEAALELDLKAIELNPLSPEPRLGAAQLLFKQGRFVEAWEHYEHRLDTRRKLNQSQIYTHGRPAWEGESLEGKTLLVVAEQGIGDEIMWGNFLPFLYDRAEKLVIGCDYRLVSAYQRRFPNADVERYVDRIISGYRYRVFLNSQKASEDGLLTIDYASPIGSVPRFDWIEQSAIKAHPEGFLNADPEKALQFKARMDDISDKPKVAIAWRSGLMNAERSYIYSSIEVLGPLMALKDKVDFINIQYGAVGDELAKAKDMHGVTIHNFEDINLKMDIEANLAIMQSCDLVISSGSAPAQFAMALGMPTILMASGKIWWDFGSEDKVLFARDAELITGEKSADWHEIMSRVAARTVDRLSL